MSGGGLLNFGEILQRLNSEDEGVEIEAKHGSQIGDSSLETISALSNEPHRGGGYLVFGLRQKVGSLFPDYEVLGVDQPDKLITTLASRCNTDLNHPLRPRIYQEKYQGKVVVIAQIREAAPQQKPVFLKKKGQTLGTYRRIGSADVLCSEEDIAYFYQEQTHRTYDETVVQDATLDDLDPEMLAEYRRLRAEANPNASEIRLSNTELAYALNAVSRHHGQLVPTIAGLLLFGTRAAIRRFFPSMRIDYIRVDGREWVADPEHRYQSIDILDPLLRAIPRTISHILDDLPKAFHLPLGQDRRQEIPVLPRDAIREVVVNAVMHRNYRNRGAIQIIRYSNRLEVRNPGISLVPDDRLGEPGSITRNEKIAAVLHETLYAETKGTGIRAIRGLMEKYDLAPPFFESDREKDLFAVYFLFHHLLSPGDLEWLDSFKDLGLSAEEQKALVYVREIGAINNALYRAINRVEAPIASRDLHRLRDLGLLRQRGQGRGTYYLPTPEFRESFPRALGLAKSLGERKSSEPIANLAGSDFKSSELRPNLAGSDLKSSELRLESSKERPSEEEVSAVHQGIPPELLIACAQLGGRSPEGSIRSVILRLCAVRPLRADELSKLVGRSAPYLRNRHLQPLIQAGQLQYLYPEDPSHPFQAYVTTTTSQGE